MKVAIVIPFYKELSALERISLKRCLDVLSNYDIIAVKPLGLTLSEFQTFGFTDIISFADTFFESIHGYNELLLSARFYEAFLRYEYILIYQLDAFVFHDNLLEWCNRGYDYIGAPWIKPAFRRSQSWYQTVKGRLYRFLNVKRKGLPSAKQLYNCVGNGGLSLRRVALFYSLAKKYKKKAQKFIVEKKLEFNEDVFWSIEMNRHRIRLKKPTYKEAMWFSIETYPEYALDILGGELPFGCHAWDKNIEVWEAIAMKTDNFNPLFRT